MRFPYTKRLILFLLIAIAVVTCKTQQRVDYKYLERLNPETRNQLYVRLERGKEMYKNHCSSCHGIFTGGKEGMPNFSEQEVEEYKIKAAMKDSTNHAVAASLTQDNLAEIFMFLRYVKTNAKPHVPHEVGE
ncbi:MAG: c-type cytochrome [Bacteroidetes bacterium]|nr:c-type cytochrome [Bacteroidota bacterium]